MNGIAPVMKTVEEITQDIEAAITERRALIKDLEIEIIQLEAKCPNLIRTDLSVRENTVMAMVAVGATNKEIAGKLKISDTTVKAHLRSILTKLHVKNRAEAAAVVAKGVTQR